MDIAVAQLHAQQAKQGLNDDVQETEKRRNHRGTECIEQACQFARWQTKQEKTSLQLQAASQSLNGRGKHGSHPIGCTALYVVFVANDSVETQGGGALNRYCGWEGGAAP